MSAECPRNLFTARSGQHELRPQQTSEAEREKGDGCLPTPIGDQPAPKGRVRERSAIPARRGDYLNRSKAPAHPSNRLVAQLNVNWRVVDDPLQWILQRRKGNPRMKNLGWRDRSFCRTRDALLRCVREYCGEVDPSALAMVKALSDWHPDWDRRRQRANLGVPGKAAPNFVEMPQ